MNKIQQIRNFFKYRFNSKEFIISMSIFFIYFTAITVGMIITNTWSINGIEIKLFYGGGLFVSTIINIIKQLK